MEMTEVASQDITEAEASEFRDRFPIFEHTTYLNSCSLGPLSRDAMDALNRYTDAWSTYGAPAWWREWLSTLNEAKARFATLIGAEADEVTIHHSISSALSSLADAISYVDRPSVVCADLDFPTIPYQWLSRRRDGIRVQFAKSHDDIRVPLEEYDTLIDSQTALVATSHTFYATGSIQPIRAIADLAHSRGGLVAVDGYHAVGVHPVDVKALDVDFYVGGTLKWLLGGPGLTFIYVKRSLIERLEPLASGWFSSANQFAFDAHRLTWPDTADRLQMGTPAVGTAYTGIAGMDIILEAQPRRIYRRIQYLTERVVARAREAGYGINSPENRDERGGIVMLRVREPEETVRKLAEKRFTVDYRPGLVRVSPHFYNTVEDVDSLMDALDSLQASFH